jgi:DNA-binding transcriptional ArsR family regulator
MTAGDIAARFAHAWPTTTRHLQVLEKAGLLCHTRQGRNRVYELDHKRLDSLREWLSWFDEDRSSSDRSEHGLLSE